MVALQDTLASSLMKQLRPEFFSAAISGSHPWKKAVWRRELQAFLVVKSSSLGQGWQARGVSFPGPPLAFGASPGLGRLAVARQMSLGVAETGVALTLLSVLNHHLTKIQDGSRLPAACQVL